MVAQHNSDLVINDHARYCVLFTVRSEGPPVPLASSSVHTTVPGSLVATSSSTPGDRHQCAPDPKPVVRSQRFHTWAVGSPNGYEFDFRFI